MHAWICVCVTATFADSPLTPPIDYVATRWYRAPELLLGSTNYTYSVDMWAIGCIMGEISDGQPIFPGESEVDQLYIVQRIIGPLTPEHLDLFMTNPRFAGLKFPDMSKPETLHKKYMGKLSKRAIALMRGLLAMEPSARFTTETCLQASYFEGLTPHPNIPDGGMLGGLVGMYVVCIICEICDM